MKILNETSKRMKEFSYLFTDLALLCKALEYKGELGVKTREAYRSGNRKALRKLLSEYHKAYVYVKKFHKAFKKRWFIENIAFFWEIHEARLGGLESRLLDCRNRLKLYLSNKITHIEELEKDILPYSDWDLQYNDYLGSISTSS